MNKVIRFENINFGCNQHWPKVTHFYTRPPKVPLYAYYYIYVTVNCLAGRLINCEMWLHMYIETVTCWRVWD